MKKFITLLVAAALIAALAASVSAAESPTDYIAYFSFDNEESGFSGGGAVAKPNNKAGEDAFVTVDTDNAYIGDGAVFLDDVLTDPYCWLEVTKEDGSSLLAGHDEITISFWSYSDGIGANWAYFVVPNIDGSPYIQEYQYEKYIGCLLDSAITCERYLCSGARTYSIKGVCFPEEWQMITVTFTNESISLYQDGEWMNSYDSCEGHNLTEILGDDHTFYIGTATWDGTGTENFNGMIDEFYVYPYAMSDEQVAELYEAQYQSTGSDAPTTDPDDDDDEITSPADPDGDAVTSAAPSESESSTTAEEKSGCGSVMGGAAAVIAAFTACLGCAVIKKK